MPDGRRPNAERMLRKLSAAVQKTKTDLLMTYKSQRPYVFLLRNAFVRTLSQGQRRRVALARLAAQRELQPWLLDEPFDALDVDGVRGVDELLAEQLRRGGSVLLSSHLPVNPALGAIEIDLDAHG